MRGSSPSFGRLPNRGQGQVDEQVFPPALRDGFPFGLARHAPHHHERPLQRAETLDDERGFGELLDLREPAQGGDRRHEWLEDGALLFEMAFGDALPGKDLTATEAIGNELLPEALVLEGVENTRRGRKGIRAKMLLQVRLQLFCW